MIINIDIYGELMLILWSTLEYVVYAVTSCDPHILSSCSLDHWAESRAHHVAHSTVSHTYVCHISDDFSLICPEYSCPFRIPRK